MSTLLQLLQQIESLECDRELKLSYARHVVSSYLEEHTQENTVDIIVAAFFSDSGVKQGERLDSLNSHESAILELVLQLEQISEPM